MSSPEPTWRHLCGLVVELCRGQAGFQQEAAILKRLVQRYGVHDVERMIQGAQRLGWTSLKSLGSAEGAGRRWALEAYWNHEKRAPVRLEAVASLLKRKGF